MKNLRRAALQCLSHAIEGDSSSAASDTLGPDDLITHNLDLLQFAPASAAAQLLEWLAAVDPAVLNVAGPRASEDVTIFAAVAALLRRCCRLFEARA